MTVRVRAAQAPTLLVVAVVVVGLVVAQLRDWRSGAVILSAGVLLAAVLRLLLPDRQAGWLVVRGKPFDVAVLATLGVALLLLAVTIPEAQ